MQKIVKSTFDDVTVEMGTSSWVSQAELFLSVETGQECDGCFVGDCDKNLCNHEQVVFTLTRARIEELQHMLKCAANFIGDSFAKGEE